MDTVPKIVSQNPYRILGVYANSPKRDIVSNKGKATAFLKVNKPVENPLDLKGILPAPNRTLDLMNEAEAHLAIAKEQIKYAQFWFLQKMTPLDDIAFNHLLAGNMAGAKEIWSKQESLSSLQNKLVCYLIENKPWQAVKTAEKLYDKFGADYIRKVDANCTLQMTSTDLLHQFIDTLGEEIGMQKLLNYDLGAETKAYISSQTIGPLINKISAEVEKTKKVDRKDPKARIEAARKLVTNTKEPFGQLKNILPATDSQYQMIADKLGLEILQCGIDYFNNSDDDDAPHTAMKMQKYAQSVVVGDFAKQRCAENVKTLQKIINELPPKEVNVENKAIKAELSKFVRLPDKISYAVNLLNNTKPHLQSIKQKLGATNAYYLKLSTQIVGNALHNIVEEVNAAQNDPQIAFRLQLGIGLDPTSMDKIKSAVREAWKATTIMDDFDLEPSFKSHYNENRNTLKSMCNQMGISTYVSRPSTTRSSTSTVSRSTTSARPSTLSGRTSSPNSSSKSTPKKTKKELSIWVDLIIAIFIHFMWGYIISANGGDFWPGFIIGGIIGWVFYINVIAWAVIHSAIEWVYNQIS